MRDLADSGIGVGRWLGIPVRIHFSWFVAALFVLFVTTHGPGDGYGKYGLLCLVVWFTCVVWHEAWHCVAVARAGEETQLIVLTPIGGLSRWSRFDDPLAELFASSAGGLGNFLGMLLSGIMIYALSGAISLQLLNPLYPVGLLANENPLLAAVNMAFWINWVMLLVNMMPTTATDGGRMLNALMWSYRHQRQLSDGLVLSSTLIVIFGLLVLAFVLRDAPSNVAVPAWFPISALAVFFGANATGNLRSQENPRDEGEEDSLGYDFSQGYTSLEQKTEQRTETRMDPPEPAPTGVLHRWLDWLERRRRRKEIEQQHQAHEDELRADVILARLHREGIDSLSAEDRALLDRVSARYRERIRE